ncbi:methylmalonyl-CoA mutase family protein [Portibacter lacus]|uniref:Methylmalonyl-CoA mutase alpha/beta chain catalytic domain-containing protein n=1 Tax=Portibacter lacus TaxID=1099794 RepID=A0AA37SJB6_9BACT|nr:methylmalonyl-CoA mutase family protein [Portibacter lacus]GLR15803.1 hypothetical protein GCM10007940_04180 [Portibacter lacus]
MSGLLKGENQWLIVQHFVNPSQVEMLDALVNGASALSLDFKTELDAVAIESLFHGIDTKLIHLYLSGNLNSIRKVLKLDINATLPIEIISENTSSNLSYFSFTFQNSDFIAEAVNCLNTWRQHFESRDNIDHHLCVKYKIDDDYISSICKIRAIKALWSLMLESFQVEYRPLHILATSGDYKEEKSIEENFIKASLQLTSAAVASADAILIEEPKSDQKSKAFSARITRNLHHLLAEEGNIDLVKDPLKGSYTIEKRTNELAEEAWNKFLK